MFSLFPAELLEYFTKFAKGYAYLVPLKFDDKPSRLEFYKAICKNGDKEALLKHKDKLYAEKVEHKEKYCTWLYDTNDAFCIDLAEKIRYIFIQNNRKYVIKETLITKSERGDDLEEFDEEKIMGRTDLKPCFDICISGKCLLKNQPNKFDRAKNLYRRAVKYNNIEAIRNDIYFTADVHNILKFRYNKSKNLDIEENALTRYMECFSIHNREMFLKVKNTPAVVLASSKMSLDCVDILLEMKESLAMELIYNKFDHNFDLFKDYCNKAKIKDAESVADIGMTKVTAKKLYKSNLWRCYPYTFIFNDTFRKVFLKYELSREETIEFLDIISNKVYDYDDGDQISLGRFFIDDDWKNLKLEPNDIIKSRNIYAKKKIWITIKPEVKNKLTIDEYMKLLDNIAETI